MVRYHSLSRVYLHLIFFFYPLHFSKCLYFSISRISLLQLCRITAISFASLDKRQDGLVPGCSGNQSPSKKSPVLSIQNSLPIFKRCVYLVKVSKGLFWKWYAGPSRITSIEQCRLMQQPLRLVRTFSWLISQLFLILKVACTHAFILVFFLFRHFYIQLCMLDNTTSLPMALFSVKVFFFLGSNSVSKLQGSVLPFMKLNNWRGGERGRAVQV